MIMNPCRKRLIMPILRLTVILATLLLTTPSHAARCGGDFNTFVSSTSAEAAAAGLSQSVISSALSRYRAGDAAAPRSAAVRHRIAFQEAAAASQGIS
jgi:membrane-bound lytic murein transglycosylase B